MPTDQPAYLRIAGDLRAQIVSGELGPGAKLPTEAVIRRTYGTSVTVAKNAIAILKGEGLVEGRRGSGVYVRTVRRIVRESHGRDLRTRPGPTSPFARDAAAAGHQGEWEDQSEHTTAPADIAARLGIDPGAPVMRTRYRFLADGEPIQLSTSWEPLTLTIGTPVERPENGPQVGVVARMDTIGVHIDECEEKVADRPAHADEIEALDLSPRRAHVQVIRRTYLAQGRPVETADIVLPAGRYELVYRYPIE